MGGGDEAGEDALSSYEWPKTDDEGAGDEGGREGAMLEGRGDEHIVHGVARGGGLGIGGLDVDAEPTTERTTADPVSLFQKMEPIYLKSAI